MNEESKHLPINRELEARIVALVLGEASEFECEELNRLIAVHPELAAFKLSIQQLHGMLNEVGQGEFEAPGDDWKLPSDQRNAVLAVIRGKADVGVAAVDVAAVDVSAVEVAAGDLPDGVAHTASAKRNWKWNFGHVAVAMCVLGFMGVLTLPSVLQNQYSASEPQIGISESEGAFPSIVMANHDMDADRLRGVLLTDGTASVGSTYDDIGLETVFLGGNGRRLQPKTASSKSALSAIQDTLQFDLKLPTESYFAEDMQVFTGGIASRAEGRESSSDDFGITTPDVLLDGIASQSNTAGSPGESPSLPSHLYGQVDSTSVNLNDLVMPDEQSVLGRQPERDRLSKKTEVQNGWEVDSAGELARLDLGGDGQPASSPLNFADDDGDDDGDEAWLFQKKRDRGGVSGLYEDGVITVPPASNMLGDLSGQFIQDESQIGPQIASGQTNFDSEPPFNNERSGTADKEAGKQYGPGAGRPAASSPEQFDLSFDFNIQDTRGLSMNAKSDGTLRHSNERLDYDYLKQLGQSSGGENQGRPFGRVGKEDELAASRTNPVGGEETESEIDADREIESVRDQDPYADLEASPTPEDVAFQALTMEPAHASPESGLQAVVRGESLTGRFEGSTLNRPMDSSSESKNGKIDLGEGVEGEDDAATSDDKNKGKIRESGVGTTTLPLSKSQRLLKSLETYPELTGREDSLRRSFEYLEKPGGDLSVESTRVESTRVDEKNKSDTSSRDFSPERSLEQQKSISGQGQLWRRRSDDRKGDKQNDKDDDLLVPRYDASVELGIPSFSFGTAQADSPALLKDLENSEVWKSKNSKAAKDLGEIRKMIQQNMVSDRVERLSEEHLKFQENHVSRSAGDKDLGGRLNVNTWAGAAFEQDKRMSTAGQFAETEKPTNEALAKINEADHRRVLNRKTPPEGLNEKLASTEAFSTFSLHVSDVSFKLAKAALGKAEWPEATKIRIEEFVNAFDYGDPMPRMGEKVACVVEQSIHPFLQQRNQLRVSMKTAAAGRASSTPLRLTLLLDNSGSMERVDRQQTVRLAFSLLAKQLKSIDEVTLISFARQPHLLADKVSGDKAGQLVDLIDNLPSEGGTNIEAALQLAFDKAKEHQASGVQNRIILLTDGAVNLGNANPESLSDMVTSMRAEGIAFDAAGISSEGLNDEVLEALTRQGDGRYYLLDSVESANSGFAAQIAGSLRPSAKNVKVQVEFNPKRVGKYKLLGFEKHRLKKEDFRNDKVDAAEMAAAEAGVAMYQFEAMPDGEGDVGSVSVRFLDLSSGQMVEHRWPIPYEANAVRADQASASLRVAASAALLAAKLRNEPLGESVDLQTLSGLVSDLPEGIDSDDRVQSLRLMIQQARQLSEK